MLPKRVLSVQKEIAMRYDRISNLWITYHNSGKFPDDFGREFFYAVGKLLQGTSLGDLDLYHIDKTKICDVVKFQAALERMHPEVKKTKTSKEEKGRCQKQKGVYQKEKEERQPTQA